MVRCHHPHPHPTPLPPCSTQHWPQTAPAPPHCCHLSESLPLPALGWSPVSPHVTPQHQGREGTALLLDPLNLPPPPPTCLKIPVFALSILCCFILLTVLKYFLFTLRPWVSWKAPQIKHIVTVIFQAKAAAIVSSSHFKKNFSINQKKFVFAPKMCNLSTNANSDPQSTALEHICTSVRSCWLEDKMSKICQTFSLDHLF